VRRDDRVRFKKLVDRLQSPVMPWSMWRQEARAIMGGPCRWHPLQMRDRPGRRTGQQHVFRLDTLDAVRRNVVRHVQVV
jgi:hypothetical protein